MSSCALRKKPNVPVRIFLIAYSGTENYSSRRRFAKRTNWKPFKDVVSAAEKKPGVRVYSASGSVKTNLSGRNTQSVVADSG